MNITYNYFNNDELWNKQNSSRELRRIDKIISTIPNDVQTLLDAGCGNGILVNQLVDNSNIERIYGIDISDEALKYVNCEKSKASITKLPFIENEFEVVVSLEVLEHLSVNDFKKSLLEISRVASKYIIISVPNNEDLEKRFIKCEKCKTRFHFTNHVRSFDKEKLVNLFKDYNFTNKIILNVGKKTNFKFISNFKRQLKKNHTIKHSHRVVCPACNNIISPNSKKLSGNSVAKKDKNRFYAFLKEKWPVNINYDWFVALYEAD